MLGRGHDDAQHDNAQHGHAQHHHGPHLILGGYSYGSMIATHVPPVADLVREIDPGTAAAVQIRSLAAGLAQGHEEVEAADSPRQQSPSLSAADVGTGYLLVSPLVPPVSWMAAVSASKRPDGLGHHSLLAVFGDSDVFSPVARLRKWVTDVATRSHASVRWEEVPGAGHFWREAGTLGRLMEAVDRWVSDTITMQ